MSEQSPAVAGGPELAVYTIPEFCVAYRFSRTELYKLWTAGKGPRRMRVGQRVVISRTAARDWERDREAVDKTEPPSKWGGRRVQAGLRKAEDDTV